MAKRKTQTAEELIRELEADPEWVAARDARDRELQRDKRVCARDEAVLVSELRSLGFAVDSVWDLVNNAPHPVLERKFVGPYLKAYPLLVQHLRLDHVTRIREGIVRALTVPDLDESARTALLEEFARENDPEIRWVLANALQVALTAKEFSSHPKLAQALDWPGP